MLWLKTSTLKRGKFQPNKFSSKTAYFATLFTFQEFDQRATSQSLISIKWFIKFISFTESKASHFTTTPKCHIYQSNHISIQLAKIVHRSYLSQGGLWEGASEDGDKWEHEHRHREEGSKHLDDDGDDGDDDYDDDDDDDSDDDEWKDELIMIGNRRVSAHSSANASPGHFQWDR